MSRIVVIRNGVDFGPYTEAQLRVYVEQNQLLLNDLARIDGNVETMSLAKAMRKCGWRVAKGHGFKECFRKIGLDFILPWNEIKSLAWTKNLQFLYLALIGLLPLAIVLVVPGKFITYVAMATYFSGLWGMFFYFFFKNDQLELKKSILCFCITALVSVTGLLLLHGLNVFSFGGLLTSSSSILLRFTGMFLNAGLPEEVCKAVVIFWLALKPGAIYKPQTLVAYGLFSGLGFGIHEGVLYQLDVNRKMDVDTAFFLDMLRLTSLPFLHAIWCGISSYFISFSILFPSYRKGLWAAAILLPASLHAAYNTFGKLGLVPAFMSVLFIVLYLSEAKTMQGKLK